MFISVLEGSELSSIGGSCASLTPEPPISYSQNYSSHPKTDSSGGKENFENSSHPNGYGYEPPNQSWNQNGGFSYRSLLSDLHDEDDYNQPMFNQSSQNGTNFNSSTTVPSDHGPVIHHHDPHNHSPKNSAPKRGSLSQGSP